MHIIWILKKKILTRTPPKNEEKCRCVHNVWCVREIWPLLSADSSGPEANAEVYIWRQNKLHSDLHIFAGRINIEVSVYINKILGRCCWAVGSYGCFVNNDHSSSRLTHTFLSNLQAEKLQLEPRPRYNMQYNMQYFVNIISY